MRSQTIEKCDILKVTRDYIKLINISKIIHENGIYYENFV